MGCNPLDSPRILSQVILQVLSPFWVNRNPPKNSQLNTLENEKNPGKKTKSKGFESFAEWKSTTR